MSAKLPEARGNVSSKNFFENSITLFPLTEL